MFTFTAIATILFITTAINSVAAVISWYRAKDRRGVFFAIGVTSVTCWTLVSGLDYAAVSISLKVFFAKWEYLFYNAALVFFLVFILSFAGYDELLRKTPVKVLLWLVPVSNILLAWTNEWHGWLWSGFSKSEFGENTYIFERGPGFFWVAFSGYALLIGIVLVSWLASRRNSPVLRRQGRLLFFASLLPLVGNLFYQFQPQRFAGVDWSSILVSGSSLLFLWALYGTRLLDPVPIAREKLVESLSDGMIVLDMQGRIIDINPPAVRMLGFLPGILPSQNLEDFLPYARSLIGNPPEQETRTELRIGNEQERYFDVLVSPLFEGKTRVVGRLIVCRDITDRKQKELRFLQLTQAVEQSPTSVVITDTEGNITYANPQFTKLTGYTLQEAVGKNPRILQSGRTPIEVYEELWQTIKAGQVWNGEIQNKKKNGDLYWEQAVIAPVLDYEGRIINFIAVKEDITGRKKIEVERESIIEELEKRNAESESLRETTVIVTSTLDITETVQRILQQIKRVVAYDSASVWLYEGTITHLVGGDGIPDIPEADKHYQVGENEPDYPLWVENLPYVLLDDVQENYLQFRKPPINYIRGWLGVPLKVRGQLIGIISLDSRTAGGFSHTDAQLVLTYANQVSIAVENARLFTNLENELEQRQKLIDELDSTNSRLAQEIEERKRIEEELQQLARTDSLTGLFNRRHFFEVAEKEFAKSVRYNRDLSVIILDLDLFKEINDTFGHLIGDQALVQIGELLRSSIRFPDIAARYGGEEFIVLLPETNGTAAKVFAERLRKLVEDTSLQKEENTVHLTVSIGVAGKDDEVKTLDQLISQADQALYVAKRAGRNRVFWQPESQVS